MKLKEAISNAGGTSEGSGTATMIYNVSAATAAPQLYPNPTSWSASFTGLSPLRQYSYKIYTPGGALVSFGLLPSSQHLALDLEVGQYLLFLLDDQQTEVLKTPLLVE